MGNTKPELIGFLRVFNLILSKGSKNMDDLYEYVELSARHEQDGYTCYIIYKDLTLTMLFHGRYSFDFAKEETMTQFMKKINKLLIDEK